MKADIHPDYHEITIVMTDGTEYKTRSTYGKEGDVLKLDVDPLTHPAWQGGTGKVIEKGQLDKFESRYGSFLSGDDDSKPAPQAKAEEAPAEEQKAAAEEAPAEEAKEEEAAPAAEEAPATEEPAAEEENKE